MIKQLVPQILAFLPRNRKFLIGLFTSRTPLHYACPHVAVWSNNYLPVIYRSIHVYQGQCSSDHIKPTWPICQPVVFRRLKYYLVSPTRVRKGIFTILLYMRILSVSAIHGGGGAIWFPVWNVFHTDRLCYAVLGWRDVNYRALWKPGNMYCKLRDLPIHWSRWAGIKHVTGFGSFTAAKYGTRGPLCPSLPVTPTEEIRVIN